MPTRTGKLLTQFLDQARNIPLDALQFRPREMPPLCRFCATRPQLLRSSVARHRQPLRARHGYEWQRGCPRGGHCTCLASHFRRACRTAGSSKRLWRGFCRSVEVSQRCDVISFRPGGAMELDGRIKGTHCAAVWSLVLIDICYISTHCAALGQCEGFYRIFSDERLATHCLLLMPDRGSSPLGFGSLGLPLLRRGLDSGFSAETPPLTEASRLFITCLH